VSELPALLAAADVAAVLLRLAPGDERSIIQRAKALAPPVQKAGAALLIDGHFAQVARSGADGANVSGIEAMQEAMPSLKPDRILGVGGLVTARCDGRRRSGRGLCAVRRAGCEGERPSADAICERLDWWAELFEPPCVGFATTFEEAELFAAAGADFVLAGDFIWQDYAEQDCVDRSWQGRCARVRKSAAQAAATGE
jgi:thiamine-phosphate pyrophosphorylase